MKPTPFAWLIASRYTLPIWLGLGLYFWFSHGGSWESFNQEQQFIIMIGGGIFAIAYIRSFPTVFFWEREQRRYRDSTISPEQRWQRAAVAQMFFLVLVAGALLYMGFTWWKSPAEPQQPTTIRAAVSFGGATALASAAYLKIKPYFVKKQNAEAPFYVSWCVPVPTSTPSEAVPLPDYCRPLLANAKQSSARKQEVTS